MPKKKQYYRLNEDVKNKLVNAIKAGNYIEASCRHAGISKTTYYRWKEEAKDCTRGKLFDFMKEIEQAEASVEIRVVAQWQTHMEKDWRAGVEYLSRKFPDRWSNFRA